MYDFLFLMEDDAVSWEVFRNHTAGERERHMIWRIIIKHEPPRITYSYTWYLVYYYGEPNIAINSENG